MSDIVRDVMCRKIKSELESKIGLFGSYWNSAKSMMRSMKWDLDKLSKITNLPNTWRYKRGLFDFVNNKKTELSNVCSDSMTGNPFNIEALLRCIGVDQEYDLLDFDLGNYIKDMAFNTLEGLPGKVIVPKIGKLQCAIPRDIIDDITRMTTCLKTFCGISITSANLNVGNVINLYNNDPDTRSIDIGIESMMNDVGLNINSDIDLSTKPFRKVFGMKEYMTDLSEMGKTLESVPSEINNVCGF